MKETWPLPATTPPPSSRRCWSRRPTQLPQAIRALRNRNFRLFWSGNFLSNIGTWMQNVAQGWLVLLLTNSAFWLGVVGFAGSIPFLSLHALRRSHRRSRRTSVAC